MRKNKNIIAISIITLSSLLLFFIPTLANSNTLGTYKAVDSYNCVESFRLIFTNKAKVKLKKDSGFVTVTVGWYYMQDNLGKSIYLQLEKYGGLTQLSFNKNTNGWLALYGAEKDTIYRKN